MFLRKAMCVFCTIHIVVKKLPISEKIRPLSAKNNPHISVKKRAGRKRNNSV